ncbi:hypothetical protein RDI58_024378 [Solanum bulbocastanum]|uniref:Uncharacterized protein n=1 Tax=Solanum bulbocastanum TaxID=147425 RepID=A0AAN8SZV7_SOLBU
MSLNIPYRIDPVGVIERVSEFFKGHPSFLLEFNTYLPNGYEIMLNDEDKTSSNKTTNYEEEHNLVKNIKKCFGNDHEYNLFVDIMMMYKKESKDINEVYHEVVVLFNDHPDLLDVFTKFLKDSVTPNPLSSLLLVLNPLLPCGYDIILNYEGKPPLKKSTHFEQVFVLLNDHPDLLDEFSGFLPDSFPTNLLSNLDCDKN